jgi:hypothetical protein
MHDRLDTVSRTLAGSASGQNAEAWLAIALLQKRAFSSAWSLAQTLDRRLSVLGHDAVDGLQLGLPLGDPSGELDGADEAPIWQFPTIDARVERSLLTPLLEAARTAAVAESKLLALARLVRRLLLRGESVIVFTEYRDTLTRIRRAVAEPSAALHGGLSAAERRAELACFSSGQRQVLVATDAAGEGLNLHHRCRAVINLELPWNPMRLEQRIGRVDRIGQRRRVHAFHLVGDRTGETRVLECLSTKVARIRNEIGAADPLGLDDREMARAIVDGTDPSPGPVATVSVPALRLIADAERTAAHLSIARTFQSGADSVADDRIIPAAVTRSRVTRQHLGGRWLAIIHHRLHDRFGRLVASRLLPLLVPPIRIAPPLSATLAEWIEQVGRSVAASDAWAAEMTALHHAFWARRCAREQDIIGRDEAGFPLQAGLFDRRALRRGEAAQTDRAALVEESQRRLEAAAQSANLDASVALALLMLPERRW